MIGQPLRRFMAIIVLLLLLVQIYPVPASAHLLELPAAYRPSSLPNTLQTKLLANDKASDDRFGNGVALSTDGNTALVGVPGEDDSGLSNNGAAYVYIRTGATWTQQAKLLASDKATDDLFGWSVALSEDGNTALIGAYTEDDPNPIDNGAAYIFTRSGTTWTQQAKLLAGDKTSYDYFGYSVSLSRDGNTALIGAFGKNDVALGGCGAAYIFIRSGTAWSQQAKLLAIDKASNDSFGRSVALSGDGNTALIGTPFKDDNSLNDSGAAYAFTRSGTAWSQQYRIVAVDQAAGDSFGLSVAISTDGSTAVIGASAESDSGTALNGAAYMFTRTGNFWVQQAKLLASDKSAQDYFGYSVALSGDGNIPVIGAWAEDDSGTSESGAVYIFSYNGSTWTQQTKLLANDKATGDFFGVTVRISRDGGTLLIGAPYKDDSGTTDNGAAYVYVNPPPPPPPDTIGIYRPSSQTFYLRNSLTSGTPDITIQYGYLCNGSVCNYPVVGDWNGDGVDTIGLYDQVQGVFQLRDQNTPGAPFYFAVLGNPNDQPLAGRWTADMTHDGIGVFRPSNGILYLKKQISTGFSDYFAVMGNPSDVGIAGDWNGDGLDSVGVYRPSQSRFYLTNNNQPSGITFSDIDFSYGDGAQDKPFVGDWTGNSVSKPGVFRNGTVMLRNTLTVGAPDMTLYFGATGDMPLAGKWIASSQPNLQNLLVGQGTPLTDPIDVNRGD